MSKRTPSTHPLYFTWKNMLARCNTPTHPSYSTYGGRGIKVCERWRDFWNFVEDVGCRPSKAHSLDRAENDGDYEPSNCRWATGQQQRQNTTKTVFITFNGLRLCVAEWARRLGIDRSALLYRLRRHSPQEAIEMGGPHEWRRARAAGRKP